MTTKSAGNHFRSAVAGENSLQIVGTINAYTALLAKTAGHRAIYLSGAGVANASFGLPDLGITTLSDVLEDARRITDCCDLPLLVDIDTGWGSSFSITRAVKSLEKAGVAAVHIEDQVVEKRCGHRSGKCVVSQGEMVDRIRAACDARVNDSFVIMARTDAVAEEGINSAIQRSIAYVEAGADMIFPEAIGTLEDYQHFCSQLDVPVLANITEFGKTPLVNCRDLAKVGVAMVLYPLSAFRAMNKAALDVYETLAKVGDQHGLLSKMQTREELYYTLEYHSLEKKQDEQRHK